MNSNNIYIIMLELRLQVHLGRDNMDISIKKEDIVKGKIIDISHDGKGILKPWGYTVFTQGGIIGDEVSVKIIETKELCYWENHGYR